MYYILFFLFLLEFYKCYKKKRLSFSFFFQISYWIVFFQVDILVNFFDLFSDNLIDFIFINETIRAEAILISQYALLAFIFGDFISARFAKFRSNSRPKILPKFKLGNIEILSGFLLFVYILMSGDMILGQYTPLDTIPGRLYVYRLFVIVFHVNLMFRLNQVKSYKKLHFSTKFIVVFYFLLSLFIGDRGPLITIAFIFLLFYMRENKISIYKSFFYGFIVALSLVFIGSVRQLRFVDSSYSSRFKTSFSNLTDNQKLGENPLLELAKSARLLPAAISIEEKDHDIPFLHFQTMYLLSTIPFLSGFYLEARDLNPVIYSSSSSLLSYQIQGGDVRYGNGTSIIADLYLDFGIYGSLIIMFIFGFLIKKAENQFYNRKRFTFLSLIYIIYFSQCIYLPRSALMMQLEKVVFILIIVYVFSKMKKKTYRNQINSTNKYL